MTYNYIELRERFYRPPTLNTLLGRSPIIVTPISRRENFLEPYVPLVVQYPLPNPRPVFTLLDERCDMYWGESPNYNEAYRKIRWPAVPIGFDRNDEIEGFEGIPLRARRDPYYTTPSWVNSLESDTRRKRRGEWTGKDTRFRLHQDLLQCMRENIPFKTKSLEYNPKDQWIYVYGNRTMRYNIRSGMVDAFTYSGVYNKVTSLFLRNFSIQVKLIRRKLIWVPYVRRRVRLISTHNTVLFRYTSLEIDLNKIYEFDDLYLPTDTPTPRGFYVVSSALRLEQTEVNRSRLDTSLVNSN